MQKQMNNNDEKCCSSRKFTFIDNLDITKTRKLIGQDLKNLKIRRICELVYTRTPVTIFLWLSIVVAKSKAPLKTRIKKFSKLIT
jgi:hypothetical protein